MNKFHLWGLILLLLLHASVSWQRTRQLLHMLQLNAYYSGRYAYWCWCHPRQLWRWPYLEPLLALFALCVPSTRLMLLMALLAFSHLWLCGQHSAPIKKPFVFTPRIWRLIAGYALLSTLLYLSCWQLWTQAYAAPLCVRPPWQLLSYIIVILTAYALGLPVWILLLNNLLKPLEELIQRYYFSDAQRRLASLAAAPVAALQTIAITGSFGKTTTKTILNSLLSHRFLTLSTPGSCNTPMGITKLIRSQLRPTHQLFIAELSARLPGDIRELCKLVHPRLGLITAIGEQHLEYFKTLERVQRTKYELIDALPEIGGVAFFNLDDPHSQPLLAWAQQRAAALRQARPEASDNFRVVTFALENSAADYYLAKIASDANGSSFQLCIHQQPQAPRFHTQLLGRNNLYDIVAALATASEIGMTAPQLAAALPCVAPIPHRLELKRSAQGDILILDDSYNANPVGFSQALAVLAFFPERRKILITPGMIELGTQEAYYNQQAAVAAAQVCDYIILVGRYNRDAWLAGLNAAQYPTSQYVTEDHFAQAQQQLQQLVRDGDLILIANDLTDDYETP